MIGLLRGALAHRRGPGVLGYAALIAATVAVPVAFGATVRGEAKLAAPSSLQTFQFRVGPSVKGTKSFWRTPSFKWEPVYGAAGYRFELATSPNFRAGSDIIWSARTSSTPAVTLPISLPWVKGVPLYWHVRVASGNGTSSWSRPASFRIESDQVPELLTEGPGYVRWSAVRGATGYEVWFVNLSKVISTTTTASDLRDYYAKSSPDTVVWRVRAVRRLYGATQPGLLPTVSHGPWSETYRSKAELNPTVTLAKDTGGKQGSLPAFLFNSKEADRLHHLYIASNPTCTKLVFNSPILRGPAFAPRSLQISRRTGATINANNGAVFTKGGSRIRPTEAANSSAPGEWARINLPDGQYYWTVVAVERLKGNSYRDLASPQAACRVVRGTFTKVSAEPAVATSQAPYATGLSPLGRLLSAARTGGAFYGFPVVTWKSVPEASQYEVQWSRSSRPWRQAGKLKTYATSAVLPLGSGSWWYRVRGVDAAIPGNQKLSWSAPARVRIAAPTFRVARG